MCCYLSIKNITERPVYFGLKRWAFGGDFTWQHSFPLFESLNFFFFLQGRMKQQNGKLIFRIWNCDTNSVANKARENFWWNVLIRKTFLLMMSENVVNFFWVYTCNILNWDNGEYFWIHNSGVGDSGCSYSAHSFGYFLKLQESTLSGRNYYKD